MELERSCGILLHISSLPSKEAVGNLGEGAYKFIDFLAASSQRYWQILPYHPVGYGYSPYQTYSAFAGNHLFIDLANLVELGFISKDQVEMYYQKVAGERQSKNIRGDVADYPLAYKEKMPILRQAFTQYCEEKSEKLRYIEEEFQQFQEENRFWLDDYALFMALKTHFNQRPWYQWDENIAKRKPKSIRYYQDTLREELALHQFLQFIFFRQWQRLKEYANEHHINIVGDIPIFVAHDSADLWANPEYFRLDEKGDLEVVAGVPPDYFSETGQKWGNPLYDWKALAKQGYEWWIQRFDMLFKYVDIVRIDHFRGFAAFWEIPAEEETAKNGHWVTGPGRDFFQTLEKSLGEVDVIAENLGVITPDVEKLREEFNFPGMKVLLFMMETGPLETFRSLFQNHQVLYSGTHDNDTLVGWWQKIIKGNKPVVADLKRYWQITDQMTSQEVCWRLLKIVCKSNNQLVLFPLQDVLGLDNRARMNTPGTIAGNWIWRAQEEDLDELTVSRLNELAASTGRANNKKRGG